jgi:hypothetical protein
MNTMPVAYLHKLRLEFLDGRIWEINIKDQLDEEESETVADKLLSIFQEYREEIKKIDFEMDIERLKKDITDSTNDLF